MKNAILRIIFVAILISGSSMASTAQTLLNNPLWDQSNQGKDAVSNRLFDALLKRNVFNRKHIGSTFNFYAVGYLKNIDFYYVSYMETQELAVDYATELYRIHPHTDISSFDYTKTSLGLDDPNQNFIVFWDIGRIDSFDDYLVVYDRRHVVVYKKNKTDKNYSEVSDIGYIFDDKNEFFYDQAKRQIKRKTDGNKKDKEIIETYQIVDGKIVKM